MVAEPQYVIDRSERSVAAIHALLDELGIGRRALFHESDEGTIFPDGTEAMTGHVLDEAGRVFLFWTDWDAARARPVFTTWQQVQPEAGLLASVEYREARDALRLASRR